MECVKMQLSDTFNSMKKEGLVDDHFTFVYSLKSNLEDPFYVEIIPEFCTEVREAIKLLAQIMDEQPLNYNRMKDYVYKIKGSSSSFGACRLAVACVGYERAIDAASKEGCVQELKRVRREMSALEERLHDCLQIERKLVTLAAEEK
ncbi:hypothetical protein Fmac_004259 [Flemingia macrophylla]|uniref:Histidine-containing phosphotransfer protein n=1 Tax=Flemingia macrophylla TaxID=520843 RepID=A0ABD1N4K4_9FABA